MGLDTPRVRLPRLFLHFFDIHFLEAKGVDRFASAVLANVRAECRRAIRLSVLAAEETFVPAASFFESELCYDVVREFESLYELGLIRLWGGGSTEQDFIEEKLGQYGSSSAQHKRYKTLLKSIGNHPPFGTRRQSATKDIKAGWREMLGRSPGQIIFDGSGVRMPRGFERRWEKVPDQLGDRAFVMENVEHLLFSADFSPIAKGRVRNSINELYFSSYTRELHCGVISELSYLAADYPIPSYGIDLPYRACCRALGKHALLKAVDGTTVDDLLTLLGSPAWNLALTESLYSDHIQNYTPLDSHMSNLRALTELADVGIVTALPEEFAAVCEAIPCDTPVDIPGEGAGRKYAIGRVKTYSGHEHTVAVCLLSGMGNNAASTVATMMMERCKGVRHVLMVGIAGAIPCPADAEKHVRLGDIVVSSGNGVIQYDNLKIEPGRSKIRSPPRPPGPALTEAVAHVIAQELRGRRPWEDEISRMMAKLGGEWSRPGEDRDVLNDWMDGQKETLKHPADRLRRPMQPRVFRAAIASANILLKDPALRDSLRDEFGAAAVEMEGSGIADATWNHERGYLVIRGMCDYCNPDKGDDWHPYAAIVAAAFAKEVIANLAPG